MVINYRNASLHDLPALMPLLHALYNHDVGEGLESVVAEMLQDDRYFKLIAEEETNGAIVIAKPHLMDSSNKICGSIIGFFLGSTRLEVDFECRCGIIEEIVVVEKYRGKGIGRELLSKFVDWAKKQHCQGLLVPCGREGFYEKEGFEKYNVPRYWKPLS